MRLYQSHASFSYVVTILLFTRRYHMFYDVRQGQMLVQGVFTHHIDRRMTSRIMIYDFHCTLMDFFLVRVMISDLKLTLLNCLYVFNF